MNPSTPLSSSDVRRLDPQIAIYSEMRSVLSECLGSGSEAWKLAPGFRSLPGVGLMTTSDALVLIRRIDRIIRNKESKVRRKHAGDWSSGSTPSRLPTAIDRARRAEEAAAESTLTRHLDIATLRAELADAAAQEKEEKGGRASELDEEDLYLGSVIERETVTDLERLLEEEEALELAQAAAEAQHGSAGTDPEASGEAAAEGTPPADGTRVPKNTEQQTQISDTERQAQQHTFTKRDSFLMKVKFLETYGGQSGLR